MEKADEALRYVEDTYKITFKPKQEEAIKAILKGEDTFAVLPTGYGKTFIYAFLPQIFDLVLDSTGSTILVISPLKSLMMDQVVNLTNLGISTCFIGELQEETSIKGKIGNGEISVLFASPEAMISSRYWRSCLLNGKFKDNLKAVIVDEAHCVTQWGEEFRKEYGRLNELRFVVPNSVPFVALTATATRKIRDEILSNLGISADLYTLVSVLPDRKNITYAIRKTRDIDQSFEWLVAELKEKKKNVKRSTAQVNKDHVLQEFPKKESTLRVIFCTVAFGMGVDIPDVDIVIHWGAPRSMEDFQQQSGRVGRDGRHSIAMILFNSYDLVIGRSTSEVKSFCKLSTCRRDFLESHFDLNGTIYENKNPDCKCCDNCKSQCQCGNCIEFPGFVDQLSSVSSTPELLPESRNLNAHQISYLRANLYDYQSNLCEERGDTGLCSFLSVEFETGINSQLINDICNCACYLQNADDVISNTRIWDKDIAADIITLIEEIEQC